MSLELQVFAPSLDDSLIPRWIDRLNSLDMTCEVHPAFSFSDHSGFLPFRLQLAASSHAALVGVPWASGFELFVGDFVLSDEVPPTPPQSFFQRVLGRSPEATYFASPETDARLEECTNVVSLFWGTADYFEFRMATLSAAVLAEITGGAARYPADELWYDEAGQVETALAEAQAYEAAVVPEPEKLHRFEAWE